LIILPYFGGGADCRDIEAIRGGKPRARRPTVDYYHILAGQIPRFNEFQASDLLFLRSWYIYTCYVEEIIQRVKTYGVTYSLEAHPSHHRLSELIGAVRQD
jgi:hypothetical protein